MQNKEIEKALKSMRIFARVHQDMTTVSAREMEIVLEYIDQLENKVKELEKENRTLKEDRKCYIEEILDMQEIIEDIGFLDY